MGLVARQRLYELLDRGTQGPVTLVAAPAGSGKTMLVSSWLRGAEAATAWVSVERDETDATHFWGMVMDAVRGSGALYAADTSAEVDAALTEMEVAATDAVNHGGEAVADEVAAQEDALSRAANGFVGALTTEDLFEAELYEAELDIALTDLTNQAEDFRTTGPEVQQAYWDGYEAGLEG